MTIKISCLLHRGHRGDIKASSVNNRRSVRGFTLIEIVVASSILGLLAVLALPALRGFVENATTSGKATQARTLVTAVNLWKMKGGAAITGTAVKPMTVVRANDLYSQIDGPLPSGETIVETGYQLPAGATFPTGWGENSTGVFSSIP